VRTAIDQLGDQQCRGGQVGVAGGHEWHQGAAMLGTELAKSAIDAVHGLMRCRCIRSYVL